MSVLDAKASPWKPSRVPSGRVSGGGGVRNGLVCTLAAALIFTQLIAFGANSDVLAAFFAFLELVCGLSVVVMLGGEARQAVWLRIIPAALVFLAALAWATTPSVLAPLHLGPFGVLAPDAVGLELTKLAGVGACVLIGALIGASRTRLRLLVLGLTLGGLVYALFALGVGQASPITVMGQPKGAHAFRFTGTFLNANAAGCAFGMIGQLALGLTRYRLGRTDPRHASLTDYGLLALAVCATVTLFGACALTQSRLALILSLACGVWVAMGQQARGRAQTVLSAAAILLLLAGLGLGASQIGSRWGLLVADMTVRLAGWSHYLTLLGAHPWFGYGLGGFRLLRQSTMTPALAPSIWNHGAAHMAILQAALEGGLPFAALICLAAGLMLAPIILIRRPSPRNILGERTIFTRAALAAVLLAAVCSFADIALNVPAVAALTALLFGTAWGDAVTRDEMT